MQAPQPTNPAASLGAPSSTAPGNMAPGIAPPPAQEAPAMPATPTSDSEQPSVDPRAEIATLKEKLAGRDADLAEHQNSATQAQADLKRKTGEYAALEQLLTELEAMEKTVETHVIAAAEIVQGVAADLTEINQQLDNELEDEFVKGINEIVEEIDGEIAAAGAERQASADALATAVRNRADAQAAHAAAIAAANEAKAAYRQLGNEIQTALARVTQLKTRARSALDAGNASGAHLLARDSKAVLDELERLVDPATANDRLNAILMTWRAASEAETAKTIAELAVEPARKELAGADKALSALMQQRDATIRERVATLASGLNPPAATAA